MSHVLFLSGKDYANLGYLLAKSIRAAGVSATSLKRKFNPNRPKSMQSRLYQPEDESFVRAVEKADVIVHMHSAYTEIPPDLLKDKKIVVFHGGSRYRLNPRKLNGKFNPHVHLSLVQTGELLELGAKNPHWLLPPVDLKRIKPNYTFHDSKLVVGHFSSRPDMKGNHPYAKGTLLIGIMMKSLRKAGFGDNFEYRSSQGFIPWSENLRRMGECDVYIESLGLAAKKNINRHDWSMTALEAAASGCITITNFAYEEMYKKEYGLHGLIVANTRQGLVDVMKNLFDMDQGELLTLKHKARAWVEEKHSFEAVGIRLRLILKI